MSIGLIVFMIFCLILLYFPFTKYKVHRTVYSTQSPLTPFSHREPMRGLALLAVVAAVASAAELPNVVMVVVDDLVRSQRRGNLLDSRSSTAPQWRQQRR